MGLQGLGLPERVMPDESEGAPRCWKDCPSHDGKRCDQLGQRAPEGHVCPVAADALLRAWGRLPGVLADIVRNDESPGFNHHEARRWDGRVPPPERGTRWLTPREMAYHLLRQLGQPVPDAIAEALAAPAEVPDAG